MVAPDVSVMNAYILSLGCPKNQADSEHLCSLIRGAGFGITTDPEAADVLLINTCGFIENARREGIDEILRLVGIKEATGARLAVLGCLSKRYGPELRRELPEVDAFFGVGEHESIREYLLGLARGHDGAGDSGAGGAAPFWVFRGTMNPSCAPLKVADGCNRRCSFCAIPSIRGRFSSRPPGQILADAELYLGAGARELMLVAQDLLSYNYKGCGIEGLMREICGIPGEFWVRPMYLYPNSIADGFLEVMAEVPKIAPYIDMPIQHASPRILEAMGRRRGGPDEFMEIIGRIRRIVPDAAIRTSVIVGFPGEGESEFGELADFMEEAGFDRLGVFEYSPEEGTRAYGLPGRVDAEVVAERAAALSSMQADISLACNERFLGRRMRAVIEEYDHEAGAHIGRVMHQAPEIDGHTIIYGAAGAAPGEFVDIEVTGADDFDLEGDVRA